MSNAFRAMKGKTSNRIVIFGDETGLEAIRSAIPDVPVSAVIYSFKRQSAFAEAKDWQSLRNFQIIRQPSRKETQEYYRFINDIEQIRPDIGLCFSYDLILRERILNIFRKGIFNIHCSLLPKYRGGNVLNWVIIKGENETGVTLHKMIPEVDAGPIILQRNVGIKLEDTALTLRERLLDVSRDIIREGWKILSNDRFSAIPQDHSIATVFPRRTPEDGYFEWTWPAMNIYNLIRALVEPWPGAWYEENGNRIIIRHFLEISEVERMQKEKIGYVIR